MGTSEETRRILDMIDSGKISASEGAQLLESARPAGTDQTMTCPYCAEHIPGGTVRCPECGSNLDVPPACSGNAVFQQLTGLGKFLVIYMLITAGMELADPLWHGVNIGPWMFTPVYLAGIILPAIGISSGILILKGSPAGWGLGILWSALQIVTIVIHGQIINQQVFHLGMNFHSNGHGLGINLIGIILLVLFIKAKPANN